MKIYQTNAALGFGQLAILIRLNKSEHGYNYLCIDTVNNNYYTVGSVVKDLEDIYVINVEESAYDIKDSPLYGSFLFEFYLKAISITDDEK